MFKGYQTEVFYTPEAVVELLIYTCDRRSRRAHRYDIYSIMSW